MTEETEEARAPAAQTPRRKKRVPQILAGIAMTALLYLAWQAISIHAFGFRDDGRQADCAIVLGTAAWHHKPSPVFEERLNHAIKLYQEGRVRALVLTGGFGDGAKFSESQVAEKYCLDHGIPPESIFLEKKSQTTVENLAEAKKVLDREGMTSALIVSDPWHLKRGLLIARRSGIDASQSGTTTSRFQSLRSRTSFLLRELYLYHVYLFFGR